MKIEKKKQGTVVILAPQDPIIAEEVGEFEEKVRECINQGEASLVLDLSRVPFIDSAGLESLQSLLLEAIRKRGALKVARPTDICKDIFRATRLDAYLEIYAEQEDAARSFL